MSLYNFWYALAVGFTIGLFLSTCSEARAMDLPRDRATQLVLAKAMAAEAGLGGATDHRAISHVLYRRWHLPGLRHMSFRSVVKRYCSLFKRRRLNRRQRWLTALTLANTRPRHWTPYADWERNKALWVAVVARAGAFLRGRVADPCRGRVWHWGGRMDPQPSGTVRVRCGDTRNFFYATETGR